MTHFAIAFIHAVAFVLSAVLLAVIVAFILGVCVCTIMRTRSNGYAQRYRHPKQRAPKHTLILTPTDKDPRVIGDVSHGSWPSARYPMSRANTRENGETP